MRSGRRTESACSSMMRSRMIVSCSWPAQAVGMLMLGEVVDCVCSYLGCVES
eukprot:COSAG06_NODE_38180_length_426_cov_0.978593_1_plen_51_part_01